MDEIKVGDLVVANRDLPLRSIKKGDKGTVMRIGCLDSEDYYDIRMETGNAVYMSAENCWNKCEKTIENGRQNYHSSRE